MPTKEMQVPQGGGRWETFRDVVVFQGKLFLDGARDVLLSPVSIGAALLDLINPGDDKGRRFYSVVRFGRRTEEWINLFSAADRHDPESETSGVDVLLEEIEQAVRDPARTEFARDRTRRLLEKLKTRK